MDPSMIAEEAIEDLFNQYADDVYRFARYAAPSTIDPRDIVQEVFLRAFQSWHSFRNESNPKTWLLHIARNYVTDLLRKKRTELAYREKHRPDLSEVSVPLDSLIELEEIVSRLKPDHRQVFILRCVQDLTVEESAAVLNWSEAKVKTTLHRAVKVIRQELKEVSEPGSGWMNRGGSHED